MMPRWFLPIAVLAFTVSVAMFIAIAFFSRPGSPSEGPPENIPTLGGPVDPNDDRVITVRPRRAPSQSPTEPDPGLEDMRIGAFEGVDQRGEPVDQSILEGGYTIMDFFFTNCPLACPGMTAAMRRVQNELEGTPVRFLSMSVDPERDTPEALLAYAENNRADQSRWSFINVPAETVMRIASEELGFNVSEDRSRRFDLGDGAFMYNINHPTRLILIGPDRRVIGLYAFEDREELKMLAERVRAVTGN